MLVVKNLEHEGQVTLARLEIEVVEVKVYGQSQSLSRIERIVVELYNFQVCLFWLKHGSVQFECFVVNKI